MCLPRLSACPDIVLKLDTWNGEENVPVARIELDGQGSHWYKVTSLELGATYSAG